MFKIDSNFKNLDLSTTWPCPNCNKEIPLTDKKGTPVRASDCTHCKAKIEWTRKEG